MEQRRNFDHILIETTGERICSPHMVLCNINVSSLVSMCHGNEQVWQIRGRWLHLCGQMWSSTAPSVWMPSSLLWTLSTCRNNYWTACPPKASMRPSGRSHTLMSFC